MLDLLQVIEKRYLLRIHGFLYPLDFVLDLHSVERLTLVEGRLLWRDAIREQLVMAWLRSLHVTERALIGSTGQLVLLSAARDLRQPSCVEQYVDLLVVVADAFLRPEAT